MAKILIIEYCPSNQSGGAERSMRTFCEYLNRNGHEVFIGYKDGGNYIEDDSARIYAGLIKLNIPVLTGETVLEFLSDVLRTRKFCSAHGITTVITHVVHAAPYLRLVGATTKAKTGMLLKWRLGTPVAGLKVRWGMAGIDRHLAVSRYTLDFWQKNGVPVETSAVVPEGIAVHNFPRSNSSIGTFHVAFAARIVHMKGLHLLLQAIERLHKEGNAITLSIAGGFRPRGSDKPDQYHCELEEQVTKAGLSNVVKFLGFVDPVESLFAKADLVVVPSILPEAQPLAIMQAMACGTLVLSSDIGGVGEVLKPKFAEFLVTPGSVDEIYHKIKTIINWSAEKRVGIAAEMKEHVIRNYQLDTLLAKTADQLNIT